MLESSLFESNGRARTRKPATVLLSATLHLFVVLVLIAVPLVHPQVVPVLAAEIGLPLPVISKSVSNKSPTSTPTVQPHIQIGSTEFIAPTTIPSDIALFVDEPAEQSLPTNTPQAGIIGSLLHDIRDRQENSDVPPPPPPPPVAAAPTPSAIRVGGNVQQANLIHQVLPQYPGLARQARIQGVVVLEATIGTDGTVQNLRVISGHPLLIGAALEAVQQWRYKPTFLNGEPIEVITTVTVNFAFQQ